MVPTDWRSRTEAELRKAKEARGAGNMGMARVCARRAAGIIVGEYFQREGQTESDSSAYGRLKKLRDINGLPKGVREIAEHLLLRVNFDQNLPVNVDLIEETHRLAKTLLNEDLGAA